MRRRRAVKVKASVIGAAWQTVFMAGQLGKVKFAIWGELSYDEKENRYRGAVAGDLKFDVIGSEAAVEQLVKYMQA